MIHRKLAWWCLVVTNVTVLLLMEVWLSLPYVVRWVPVCLWGMEGMPLNHLMPCGPIASAEFLDTALRLQPRIFPLQRRRGTVSKFFLTAFSLRVLIGGYSRVEEGLARTSGKRHRCLCTMQIRSSASKDAACRQRHHPASRTCCRSRH